MKHPEPSAVVELLKPLTWFAPMWAFGCGVISAGVPVLENWAVVLAGILVAGPLVCGTSQAVNDWFDREVDAINEPNRPIPSARIPNRWGLIIAVVWTGLSLVVATALGFWGFLAAVAGLALAWAYSAPPLRLKRSGWFGPSAVAICYEGLPWFTGAAVMAAALPDARVIVLAALFSFGAFGIMTLNDFKAVAGDRITGVRSLPVMLGVVPAARVACLVMALPQAVVLALLWVWDLPFYAAAMAVLLAMQLVLMRRLLSDPRRFAPWYNATGTSLYVLGMLLCAIALGMSGGEAGLPLAEAGTPS